MAISSAGLGSGLDVNSIVTGLMNVEKIPLNNIAKQKTAYQAEVSAYGTLKSALSAFQTSLAGLSSLSKFNAQTATSSNLTALTATANGSAGIGDYAINVTKLAASQKLSVGGFASTSDTVGTGTLTISFGTYTATAPVPPTDPIGTFVANPAKTDINIVIDGSNNTLTGVRDAINATNSSVSATIVNDGVSNNLVITSKDTGKVNSLKVTGLAAITYDPTLSAGNTLAQIQAPENATLTVDGLSIVKSSNTISDVISGVTLNLLSTTASAFNLSVTSDKSKVQESITSFVDAYNKLDTSLRSLTKYDETGKASGVLLGDSTARSVISQIRAVMNKTIANQSSFNSLSQVGVRFERSGQLSLNTTTLTNALSSNFSDIASVFAPTARATDAQVSFVSATSATKEGTYPVILTALGSGTTNATGFINGVLATGSGYNLRGALGDDSEGLTVKIASGITGARGTVSFSLGYASQLDRVITNLLSDNGILASKTEGINNSIKRLDKQTDALNLRLTSIEARYREQFSRLDTLMSSMSTTSAFLTQQLAALAANNK